MEVRSAWCALEGRLTRRVVPMVFFLSAMLSPASFSLSLSFYSQGGCPPPRLRGPRRSTEVPPARHQPRPLAHVRAPKVQRWVQVQVHQVLALLVPQAPSSRRYPPSLCPYAPLLLIYDRSRRTGCTARGCCWYAETVCLLLPERFIVISTLCFCCASPAACCWCRVPAACF